jgi:hypothetical protein
MKILLIIYVSILVISVHISMIIASEPYQSHSEQLTQLMNWMTGSFSSEERAEIDTSYYNVSLYMTRIWNENSDGFWIYVEQALATNLERPYRQRIYQLAQKDDSTFESRVYLLPNAIRFAGAWKSPKVFDKLTPDSLTLRDGCSIILFRKDGDSFQGVTIDKKCKSGLRGASYATSQVSIFKDQLISWDRGIDENGNQVWGATKGGYIFKKIKE